MIKFTRTLKNIYPNLRGCRKEYGTHNSLAVMVEFWEKNNRPLEEKKVAF